MAVRGTGLIAGLIVGGILAAAGFMVAFWLGKPIRDQAVASTSWPATEGRIVHSVLEESRNDGKVHYSADIRYAYDVDGKSFAGTQVWVGDKYTSSPGDEFRAAVARYPVGKQVQVHYDPAAPGESVLEPGVTWSGSIVYFIGLGLLGVGSLVLLSTLAPVLLVAIVLASGIGARRRSEETRDFERPPPRPSVGGRADSSLPEDGDDGITIG